MHGMEVEQPREEESTEMIEIIIKEFIATARAHLFGLSPIDQPAGISSVAHQAT
jgi:hypothetical protein